LNTVTFFSIAQAFSEMVKKKKYVEISCIEMAKNCCVFSLNLSLSLVLKGNRSALPRGRNLKHNRVTKRKVLKAFTGTL